MILGVMIGGVDRQDIPEVYVAARRRGPRYQVDCPYCGMVHEHSAENGYRRTHCGFGDDYWIVDYPHVSAPALRPFKNRKGRDDRFENHRCLLYENDEGIHGALTSSQNGISVRDRTVLVQPYNPFEDRRGQFKMDNQFRLDVRDLRWCLSFRRDEDFRRAAQTLYAPNSEWAYVTVPQGFPDLSWRKLVREKPVTWEDAIPEAKIYHTIAQPNERPSGWREFVETNLSKVANPVATTSMRPYVNLYRDGDAYALSTNITDERVFMEQASAALVDGITTSTGTDEQRPANHELSQWLPQVVDVVCKLRGYKAPSVEEQRVLTAGRITPRDTAIVATSVDATPIVGRIEPEAATA